jgi:hypothetical protein
MDINQIRDIVEKDGIVFLTYGGFLSQTLISEMTEALEKETSQSNLNMGVANNIFTIFIELSQNIINYSKVKSQTSSELKSEGLIVVGKESDDKYYIHSQNIVNTEDKEKIEPKLLEIQSLDREGIKKRYKELRRSGKNTHGKGGGIGFYEIGKRSNTLEYDFKQINESKFYFSIKSIIDIKEI